MATKKELPAAVQVRILVDGPLGKADAVVTLAVDDLALWAGQVDAAPEAVAYALTLAV